MKERRSDAGRPDEEILDRAFAERYGVAAINVVNDLTMEAVLPRRPSSSAAADRADLGQDRPDDRRRVSVRDVARPWPKRSRCRSRCTSTTARTASDLTTACGRAGTRCCSTAPSSTSRRTPARRSRWSPRRGRYGAHVEGEIEGVSGRRGRRRLRRGGRGAPARRRRRFIQATGVDCFAPAIGNAHGMYTASRRWTPAGHRHRRAAPIPMALHGGTGLTTEQFTDLIARGCAKVNISTALKITFIDAHRDYLDGQPGKYDPPALFVHSAPRSRTMAEEHIGSSGRPEGDGDAALVTRPALIFDCDGVLADTERDGHLPAFNQTFAEFGLPVRWSEEEYGEKLRIGGGKERMAAQLTPSSSRERACRATPRGSRSCWRLAPAQDRDLHRRWSPPAGCPPRPGIARIIGEALDAGWTAGRRLDLGRAVGARGARARRRAARRRRIRGLRRRRRAGQEARPGHLPARARAARDRRATTPSWSRTRATACWPRPAPACAAS